MQLGIDTYSFHLAFQWGGLDIFAYLRHVKALGLDGVKINMGGDYAYHLGSADPAHLRAIRDLRESLGLYLELDTRGTAPRHLEKSLRICHALGGDILRTYAIPRGDVIQDLHHAVLDLRAVTPLCAELGVRIAFENHEYETAQQVLNVVEAVGSPHVGLLVDTGNSAPLWEDPLAAVRTMAPRAISTHFKDQVIIVENGEPLIVGTPLGRGALDCAACWKILVENSPLARINIEMCYGYSAPFRLPQDQGHGGRLGEDAFRITPPPHKPAWIMPHPSAVPPEKRAEVVAWQLQGIAESVAFMKHLRASNP